MSRSDTVAVARVELAELAPENDVYLGRLGYLTLVLFENLSRAVTSAPTTAAKTRLSVAAAEVLDAHEGLVTEMRRLGIDPVAAMDPFRAELDDFQRRTMGTDWHEILVTCYLTAGFLSDFFSGLAAGLPAQVSSRVSDLLDVDAGEAVLVEELRAAIDASPRLASRLAMWGRRLVGDTMLVARRSLAIGREAPGEERIEPVFTELIAAHTRRMDALGLTA
ncbi:MAG TPA: ferritin-like fold-containing protein [Pseudolysinimonas sp.]|nr:ferritin-like fold-containing protein [Pseudolysinimonas sp.]